MTDKEQNTTELLSLETGMTTGSRTISNDLTLKPAELQANDEALEQSPEETRRSSVQIRPAPPKAPFSQLQRNIFFMAGVLFLRKRLVKWFEYYKHILKTWFSSLSKPRQFTQF